MTFALFGTQDNLLCRPHFEAPRSVPLSTPCQAATPILKTVPLFLPVVVTVAIFKTPFKTLDQKPSFKGIYSAACFLKLHVRFACIRESVRTDHSSSYLPSSSPVSPHQRMVTPQVSSCVILFPPQVSVFLFVGSATSSVLSAPAAYQCKASFYRVRWLKDLSLCRIFGLNSLNPVLY